MNTSFLVRVNKFLHQILFINGGQIWLYFITKFTFKNSSRNSDCIDSLISPTKELFNLVERELSLGSTINQPNEMSAKPRHDGPVISPGSVREKAA